MADWRPLLAAVVLAGCAIPNPRLDEGRLRDVTEGHFGSDLVPIEVGPVVVSGDHAIVDWTQAGFGGRALYERYGGGWMLLLCSGDSIRRADNLERAGVPAFNARAIADQLAAAEATMPAERRARLRRFTGTLQDHQNYLKSLERQAGVSPGPAARPAR